MQCNEIIENLEKLAPISLAESWDNIGLLAGRRDKQIYSVMIALDATDEVVEEAVRKKVSLLITHHPLIFSAIKKVNADDFIGRRLVKLLQEDICYYAMHTNFDVVGMAYAAAEKLKLADSQVLTVMQQSETGPEGIGRYGHLSEEMELSKFAEYVKGQFQLQQVKVFGSFSKKVKKIAICPGSGKMSIVDALAVQADVLVTGDIDHHTGMDAVANGLCIIDAGHYGLEKIFVPYMQAYLEQEFKEIKVYLTKETEPFSYI